MMQRNALLIAKYNSYSTEYDIDNNNIHYDNDNDVCHSHYADNIQDIAK